MNVEIEENGMRLSNINEIQRNSVTNEFLHIDFYEVSQSKKMTIIVNIDFFGESVDVKKNCGILDIAHHKMSVCRFPFIYMRRCE
jgi:hypothetical protein